MIARRVLWSRGRQLCRLGPRVVLIREERGDGGERSNIGEAVFFGGVGVVETVCAPVGADY